MTGSRCAASCALTPSNCSDKTELDKVIQVLRDRQCTEVKKGEINYSEIWLFQASLGYF